MKSILDDKELDILRQTVDGVPLSYELERAVGVMLGLAEVRAAKVHALNCIERNAHDLARWPDWRDTDDDDYDFWVASFDFWCWREELWREMFDLIGCGNVRSGGYSRKESTSVTVRRG